jgi:ABC-type oligopeptide transport system substrate-binding subunit
MQKRRTSTALAAAAATSLLLSACAPQAGTPIVQTVEVRVTEIVEKQVEVEKIVEVTATPVPEWTRPHPILSDIRVRRAIAHCTNPLELIGSV